MWRIYRISFESSNARKISLEGGNQDPGDPGVGKVRGERIFFPFKQGGGTDPGWHYVLLEVSLWKNNYSEKIPTTKKRRF